MKLQKAIKVAVGGSIILSLASGAAFATGKPDGQGHGGSGLTRADCDTVIDQAVAAAMARDSDFRPDPAKTKMQIACLDRKGNLLGFKSMDDAWVGSIDIAKRKAFTAASLSSDENALTSRTIGCASQPGGPLWQIGNSNIPGTPTPAKDVKLRGFIEFPGGVPLYKNGRLVGGVGVSGDSVLADEDVAVSGSAGYEAPANIRSDTVVGVAFTNASFGGKCFK